MEVKKRAKIKSFPYEEFKDNETYEKLVQELNQNGDGIECVIACGFVYGEAGYDLDALLDQADQLMYEDKQKKKQQLEKLKKRLM